MIEKQFQERDVKDIEDVVAIDQLFRERGIEIAFPQRDIHIRSTVENSAIQEAPKAATESG